SVDEPLQHLGDRQGHASGENRSDQAKRQARGDVSGVWSQTQQRLRESALACRFRWDHSAPDRRPPRPRRRSAVTLASACGWFKRTVPVCGVRACPLGGTHCLTLDHRFDRLHAEGRAAASKRASMAHTRRPKPTWVVVGTLSLSGILTSLQHTMIIAQLPDVPNIYTVSPDDSSWVITITL